MYVPFAISLYHLIVQTSIRSPLNFASLQSPFVGNIPHSLHFFFVLLLFTDSNIHTYALPVMWRPYLITRLTKVKFVECMWIHSHVV